VVDFSEFGDAAIMNVNKLKVLLVHNSYQERGGEDESFEAEKSLLLQNGHAVCEYVRSNLEIESYTWQKTAGLALRTISASDSVRDLRALISTEKPAIVHFNNTFPLISPAAYQAGREAGIPVIQNLRNYRLVCPNALFFRDHHVCEDCLGKLFPWPGVIHACYRDSHVQSGVVATMLAYHRVRRTWQTDVDAFVALTEFSRGKFIEGGLPRHKIVVKPNFVYDRGVAQGEGKHALFVGRLIEGKGLFTLLSAWKECRDIPLKIVGDGPALSQARSIIESENLKNVELCGRRPASDVFALLKDAKFLVFPAIWYEAFPRVLLESFACGRTVIASDVGASAEVVDDGRTGLLFRPSDSRELAEKVNLLWGRPDLAAQFGREARREYEKKYTPEIAYQMLTQIYDDVSRSRTTRSSAHRNPDNAPA
jgi:glycosyltransferase involved in cell wall biosynthesis